MAAPPWILVGNPENRRVTMFQAALAARGRPPARVVSWIDLLGDRARLADLADREALVRVDSFGEDFAVEKALLRLGFEDAAAARVSTIDPRAVDALAYDLGRILCPAQHHLGFRRLLDDLARIFAAHPRWRVLNEPASIADLFDKRVTSRRYHALSVPVPEFLDGATSPDALRARMDEAGFPSVYVKLSSGSSASCLAVFHRPRRGDECLMTTIERARTGWYNSRRVRRVAGRRDLDEVLGFLLREGSQIERAIDKARTAEGRFFDLRVLVVAGEPAFTVVRTSPHPITNLHLGGQRGDLAALRAACPDEAWESAMASCRRVFAAHRSLHVGVDLLFEPRFRGHRVVEANAFGDLLPNLTRDGLSVYEWEIEQAERYSSTSS